MSIVVGTDGSTSAIERARTVLKAAYPQRYFPFTDAEFNADTARTLTGWKQLANVVILLPPGDARSSRRRLWFPGHSRYRAQRRAGRGCGRR
jgi:hypothetical protein